MYRKFGPGQSIAVLGHYRRRIDFLAKPPTGSISINKAYPHPHPDCNTGLECFILLYLHPQASDRVKDPVNSPSDCC